MEKLKHFFAEPTVEEQIEQELKDVYEIAKLPAHYPNFNADRACQMIKEEYPDIWYNHSDNLIKMAKTAEEHYDY